MNYKEHFKQRLFEAIQIPDLLISPQPEPGPAYLQPGFIPTPSVSNPNYPNSPFWIYPPPNVPGIPTRPPLPVPDSDTLLQWPGFNQGILRLVYIEPNGWVWLWIFPNITLEGEYGGWRDDWVVQEWVPPGTFADDPDTEVDESQGFWRRPTWFHYA